MRLIISDLRRHGLLLGRCEPAKIQLIAQQTESRHIEPALDGAGARRLVVGRSRDVTAHHAGWVAITGARLNELPLVSVCIVAGPDLRHITQDAQIEPVAARGAALEQHIRVLLHDALQHAVKPQDIAVGKASLLRQSGAVIVRDMTVHIPFDIVDGRACQRGVHVRNDVVLHLGAAQIQHILVAARGRATLPGVWTIQSGWARNRPESAFTISGSNHKPNSSPRACTLSARPARPPGSFLRLTVVIAQARCVIVPCAKPSVVQHEQLRPQLRRVLCQCEQFALVKIEIGGLPVVQQHGRGLFLPICRGHDVLLHKSDAGLPLMPFLPAPAEGEHGLRASRTASPGASVHAEAVGLNARGHVRVYPRGSTSAHSPYGCRSRQG